MWTGWLFPTYAPKLTATCKIVKTGLLCKHIRQLAFNAKIITCALAWSEITRRVMVYKAKRTPRHISLLPLVSRPRSIIRQLRKSGQRVMIEFVLVERETAIQSLLTFILIKVCIPIIPNQLTNQYFRQSRFCLCIGSKSPQQVIISIYSKTGFYKIPCFCLHCKAFKIAPYPWKYDVSFLGMILLVFHSRTHSPFGTSCRPRGCSMSFRGSRKL